MAHRAPWTAVMQVAGKENQPRGQQGKDENGQPRDGQLNTWVRHVGARFKTECPEISSSWLKNNPDIKEVRRIQQLYIDELQW